MKYSLSKNSFFKTKADASIIFVLKNDLNHKWIKDKKLLKNINFSDDAVVFLPECMSVYVGINCVCDEEISIAASKAYSELKKSNCKSAKVGICVDFCDYLSVKALVEGFELGSYEFNKYKSKKTKYNLQEIVIVCEEITKKDLDIKAIKQAINDGKIIAEATNFAKDLINTTPQDCNPIHLAKEAKKLSELKNVSCEIFDEKFLKKENMNAFLAVNCASIHPPRLIHLKYKPKNAKQKVIFVGKGLTYDSGGLSLKPSSSMITMKADKSGGVAVLGIINAVAKLELPIEVHGIVGATENMIGGDAYKLDDVLIARNGKSIEVRNTDAEGRLVLADCLDYAQDFKPDYLIDLATLTGACVVALGDYTTGILGKNDELQQEFFEVSKFSGELTTPLYTNRYLEKLIKSSVADISNVSSSRYGGAITAGVFLSNFVKKEYQDKWLHLDIAGPAYVESAWGYNQYGATGAGVRMCITWLKHLIKKGN